jgi:hypothetical protein
MNFKVRNNSNQSWKKVKDLIQIPTNRLKGGRPSYTVVPGLLQEAMRPGSTVARGLLARLEATLGRPSSTRNTDDAREVRCRGMADGEMVMAKGRERLHGWTPGDTMHRPRKVDIAAADRSGASVDLTGVGTCSNDGWPAGWSETLREGSFMMRME